MNDPLLNLLGLSRRAGRVELGFEAAKAAIRAGRACLVLAAADLSDKTVKELNYHAGQQKITLIQTAHNIIAISDAVGMKTGVVALTDAGLAAKALLLLKEE